MPESISSAKLRPSTDAYGEAVAPSSISGVPPAEYLEFESAPSVLGAYGALLRRKTGLPPGTTIPRIKACITRMDPDTARIAEYRRLCGFRPGATLPITLPHALAAPLHLAMLTTPTFPLPVLGLIHLRNRIVQHRAIPASAPMRVTAEVEGHTITPRGIEFDITTVVEVAGERMWEGVTTVLRRPAMVTPANPHSVEPETANDGEVPMRSVVWHVPADMGRRFAAIGRDYNPIHLYAITARAFGFPRAIVHGMWSLARCVAQLADEFPSAPMRLDVAFRKPVLLPSTVQFSAKPEIEGTSFTLRSPDASKIHLTGRVRAGAR